MGRGECFSAYSRDDKSGAVADCFADEMMIGTHLCEAAASMVELVHRNGIDIVVVQGEMVLPALLREMGLPRDVAIVFAYHFEPGWEEYANGFWPCFYLLTHAHGTEQAKAAVKLLGYPLYRVWMKSRWHAAYRSAYENADRTVLLSDGFSEAFLRYGGIEDGSKLVCIPNMLSSTRFLEPAELMAKEKTVLIVTRFEEIQKKITLALKAWELVKRDSISDGWKLRLVGHGRDEAFYRRMVEHRHIPAVEFAGRRDPIDGGDYLKSSLFLMSSATEGWGLTLTEAQQFGCVPVAFDSYASARDIVTDGSNGLLVPYPNTKAYAASVLSLMANRGRREQMALAAVEAARRYTQDQVAARWCTLFESLTEGVR